MKASDLIKELEKAIEDHGDLEVESRNARADYDEVVNVGLSPDQTIRIISL